MRKRTVRTGLRLMIASVSLLLLGTFYSHQINALFALPGDGATEFAKLAFFWSGIFGAAGVIVAIFGSMQRAAVADKFSLAPAFFLVVLLLALFFALCYRSLFTAPAIKPLKQGETLII